MKFSLFKSREAKIGGLIILTVSVFIWGFNFMKGKNILKPSNYYYCSFENVGGLMESNFVTVHGYKVGIVEDMGLSNDNASVQVTLVLDKSVNVTENTTAVLYSIDMLGTKAIRLEINPGNPLKAGETLRSVIEKDMLSKLADQFAPVQSQIETIVMRIDSVVAALNAVVSPETVTDVKATINNLKGTTASLNLMLSDKQSNLNRTIYNLNKITSELSNEETGIGSTLKNFNQISDSLAKSDLKRMIARIDSAVAGLNSVITKIDSNQGSLGQLVHDKALYDNLAGSADALDKLLNDLQQQPSKYVHLSLIDWGKDVYIDENGVTRKVSKNNVSFAVLVRTSVNAIPLTQDNFKDHSLINEHKQKNVFYYTIGKYNDYKTATEMANKLKEKYPAAEVLTFEGEKIVPLEKVLQ
jgi:phospholipid/cholesterol/gamma-HCH transport system substrate-binding protein